ncbi:MAG: AraC family transcriptional regulator ligand-binding domain-containing protein [Halioglobus sp.]
MPRKLELSAAYARLTLQSGVAPAAELLRGVAITEAALQDMEFIDASDLAVMFRNYDRCIGDCSWPARLGSRFNITAHGPLGFAALSAPTLGEAMDVMGNLSASRNTAVTAWTHATQKHYCLSVADRTGEPDFGGWLMEVVLKIMESLLSTILGHPVGKNVLIRFAHAGPPHAAHLAACFDAAVEFAAHENSIAVPLAWRQLPSPLHDEPLYRANVIKCRELIAAREQAGSVAVAVRNQLSNHFDTRMLHSKQPGPPPTLAQVADAMHLTSRTLIRRLQREDTAYKDLLESLRKDYAERLLRDARLNVADVAEILGYREVANFSRAFRRWYGVSPAAWRRG